MEHVEDVLVPTETGWVSNGLDFWNTFDLIEVVRLCFRRTFPMCQMELNEATFLVGIYFFVFFFGGVKSLSKGTNLSVLFAVVCDSGWQIYDVFGRITQPPTAIATLIPLQVHLIWVVADSQKKTCQRKGLNKKACEIRFIKNIGYGMCSETATPRFTICQRLHVVNVHNGVTSTNSNRSWFSSIGFVLDLCGKEVSHELLWVAGFSIPLGSV